MHPPDTMAKPGKRVRLRLLDRKAIAWITLGVTLVLTFALWRYVEQQVERRGSERFQLNAEIEHGVLVSRLEAHVQSLRGVAGLFAGSTRVDRAEWNAYIEALALDRSLPGVQAIGYARVFGAGEREAIEREARAEGLADFAVHPRDDAGQQSAILFISPLDEKNRRALGYDMLTEPARRAAMERAAQRDAMTLAGPVALIQNGSSVTRPGYVAYLPIRARAASGTGTPPAPALSGHAFASFYVADMVQPLFGGGLRQIDLSLYDGSVADSRLLFSTAAAGHVPAYRVDLPIEFGERLWIARFGSSALFEAQNPRALPLVILAGGITFDLLLFTTLLINASHRRRMASATARLTRSREEFRTLVENVPGVVFRCEAHPPWQVMHISRRIVELTGEGAERFMRGECHFADFIAEEDIPPTAQKIAEAIAERRPYVVEYRMLDRKGRQRWVSEHGQAHVDDNGAPLWLDGVILDITEHRAAEEAIRNLAFVDTLTQLPNRRFLIDRLRQGLANSRRNGRHGALLFIDLDHFKTVNDTHGHDAGDQLLCEVATRLRQNVREGDTVARLGGDEFVVMLEDMGDSGKEACDKAAHIADNILTALNRPFTLDGKPYHNTPSIGISCFSGADSQAEALLRRADEAMYRAKAGGRNRVETNSRQDA